MPQEPCVSGISPSPPALTGPGRQQALPGCVCFRHKLLMLSLPRIQGCWLCIQDGGRRFSFANTWTNVGNIICSQRSKVERPWEPGTEGGRGRGKPCPHMWSSGLCVSNTGKRMRWVQNSTRPGSRGLPGGLPISSWKSFLKLVPLSSIHSFIHLFAQPSQVSRVWAGVCAHSGAGLVVPGLATPHPPCFLPVISVLPLPSRL